MEYFFEDQIHDDIFWYNHDAIPVHRSAFRPYSDGYGFRFESGSNSSSSGSGSQNLNKRMIEFARKSRFATTEMKESESERCRKHMINERMRREKEKLNYLALHSLLPPGTKNDKNSIIRTSAKVIQELECNKQELERRNGEIELKSREDKILGKDSMGTKIKVSVKNPISGIDSMLEVLRCLKKLGTNTNNIQSDFSNHQLTATLDIQTQMEAAVVEGAVHEALQEVEQKLLSHFLEAYSYRS